MAASLSLIGLAYAHVDLPGTAAADAIETVFGIHLPNQDAPDSPTKPENHSPDTDEPPATEGRGNGSDNASLKGENAGTHNDKGQANAEEHRSSGQKDGHGESEEARGDKGKL